MQTSKFSLVADTVIDGHLFLTQTLAHGDATGKINAEKLETLSGDIAAIAHKLITMKVADLANAAELRTQVQTAFALTSLGLEYGSKGDLDKAVRVLLANRAIKFFQIGNTLTDKLCKQAKHLLEHAVILPPDTISHLDIDPIRIYNHVEAEFLDAVTKYNSTVATPQVTIKNDQPPRAFMQLSDLTVVHQQLDYIETRWTYVEALPLSDIFTIDPPLNLAVDPIQTLTLSLMINLSLYSQIHFQIEGDEFNDFRDIAYDENSGNIRPRARQRLLDWIEHYLKQDNQPEAVRQYATAYWDACLEEVAASHDKSRGMQDIIFSGKT